jgi:hypothetical protein
MKASLYHLAGVLAMLSVSFSEFFHVGMKW